MMRVVHRAGVVGLAGLSVAIATVAWAASSSSGWTSYRNERYGFALSVPGDVFVPGEARNKEQGALWIGRDGQARLLAVAARNETGETMQSYRTFLMQNTYKGANFDYTPVRENWFVLSGVQGGQVFYERIVFACDGRYIYGWQMRYSTSRKRFYDRIVEQVHRTFEPGRGEDGNCGPQ